FLPYFCQTCLARSLRKSSSISLKISAILFLFYRSHAAGLRQTIGDAQSRLLFFIAHTIFILLTRRKAFCFRSHAAGLRQTNFLFDAFLLLKTGFHF
ncbi:MAG: hypothetical protein AB8B77_03630, partial [Alphaproteobacteria bacterium]